MAAVENMAKVGDRKMSSDGTEAEILPIEPRGLGLDCKASESGVTQAAYEAGEVQSNKLKRKEFSGKTKKVNWIWPKKPFSP